MYLISYNAPKVPPEVETVLPFSIPLPLVHTVSFLGVHLRSFRLRPGLDFFPFLRVQIFLVPSSFLGG